MKHPLAITALLSAAVLMGGCAEEYIASGGGAGAMGMGPQGYVAWYDGYYGPFTNGYWGPDGVFYYRGTGGRYLRDDQGHFRRDAAPGFQPVRGHPRGGSTRHHNEGEITHPKS